MIHRISGHIYKRRSNSSARQKQTITQARAWRRAQTLLKLTNLRHQKHCTQTGANITHKYTHTHSCIHPHKQTTVIALTFATRAAACPAFAFNHVPRDRNTVAAAAAAAARGPRLAVSEAARGNSAIRCGTRALCARACDVSHSPIAPH